MPKLNVNIDLVARLREMRKTSYPDLIEAARIAEAAGCAGITVHLRGDRRHIQDEDLPALKKVVKTRLNLEMAVTEEMIAIALETKPDMISLVPEAPGEVTTQGGLDVAGNFDAVKACFNRTTPAGIHPGVFIDPDMKQIDASLRAGAKSVELCTANYSDVTTQQDEDREFELIEQAAAHARDKGLLVNLGHGLTLENTARLAALPGIEDFNIGHSIITRAVFVGLEKAVADMLRVVERAAEA